MSDLERLSGLQDRLHKEIKAAHEAIKKPLSSEDLAKIVRQVMQSLGGNAAGDLKFYAELKDMAQYIREAREEISAIGPRAISADHIPSATDELDAVVGATEEATNKIMDVCDEIGAIAGQCPPDVKGKLTGCTTRIFEACNFQDVTGQRITKVVATLKHIDTKIEALMWAMGEEIHAGAAPAPPQKAPQDDPDKALLNGPQLKAASQADIDKLMGQ